MLLGVVAAEAIHLAAMGLLLCINLIIVLVALAAGRWSCLLKENIGHAVAVEVEERVGVRRRNEAVLVRLGALRVVLARDEEVAEASPLESLANGIEGQQHHHIVLLVAQKYVGPEEEDPKMRFTKVKVEVLTSCLH